MSLLLASGVSVPDDPSPFLWLTEENWQPDDEYEVSTGYIVNLTNDAAVVTDDSETRIAIWEETPEVDVDEQYRQDDYTEPILGNETFEIQGVESQQDDEYDTGLIPDFIEAVVVVVDDLETRSLLWDDGIEEELTQNEFFTFAYAEFDAPIAVVGRLKYWTGSTWSIKVLKEWDGSSWVTKTLKYWNGTTWNS